MESIQVRADGFGWLAGCVGGVGGWGACIAKKNGWVEGCGVVV